MECFVVGEDTSVTTEKWQLIHTNSRGLWSSKAPTLNGNLGDFFRKDQNDKVVLLACHCELIGDGSDRRFYNLTNDVQYTYKEIEELFDAYAKPKQRLYLWVLTCENSNADVMALYYSAQQLRGCGPSAKLIYPRVIVSEIMDRSFGVTDDYIFEVLTKHFAKNVKFPDQYRGAPDYLNSHLELGLELEITAEEESVIIYGARNSLLKKWVNALHKGHTEGWLSGPCFTGQTIITWKSSEDAPVKYKGMEIHSHVKLHNGSSIHDNIHAKISRFSKIALTVPGGQLYQFLSEGATRLLDDSAK
jgi:hypothetical protein